MKLDGNVCRGSLIIFNGESYAVVRKSDYRKTGFWQWWTFPIKNLEAGEFKEYTIFSKVSEVDSFFPGNVYPLPDYII